MNKTEALNYVATNGYNVGFGAKKHFATFDIIEKIPGIIGFFSILFGIISSNYLSLNLANHASVFLTIFGVVSVYISCYLPLSKKYEKSGIELTRIYRLLKISYSNIKSDESKIDEEINTVEGLMGEFYKHSISKQILFSDWYAHYKFFGQAQTQWVDEELGHTLLKDKIPTSLYYFVFISILVGGISYLFFTK